MERNYGAEIDSLKKELEELKELIASFVRGTVKPDTAKPLKNVRQMKNMHPDKRLSEKMEELCALTDKKGVTGMVTYLGVYSSGGRQSNWIRNEVCTDDLLALIENRTAEKVLNCIGSSDRLNILLALLRKPMSVAEIVSECGLNSTGQAYHHMKPLLAADLIVQPHKVQGIIMLLAGICDLVDETYSKGTWDNEA
jgi:DNA gyrase subunit B